MTNQDEMNYKTFQIRPLTLSGETLQNRNKLSNILPLNSHRSVFLMITGKNLRYDWLKVQNESVTNIRRWALVPFSATKFLGFWLTLMSEYCIIVLLYYLGLESGLARITHWFGISTRLVNFDKSSLTRRKSRLSQGGKRITSYVIRLDSTLT